MSSATIRRSSFFSIMAFVSACSAPEGDGERTAEEPVQESTAAQSEADTVCNRAAPELPFSLGKRDAFTLQGNAVTIPIQIDSGIAESELTASAMVMIQAQEPTQVAFSPSWSGESLAVPLERVAGNVPNGWRATVAIELTHASGASGWSEAIVLERENQGWGKVRIRG